MPHELSAIQKNAHDNNREYNDGKCRLATTPQYVTIGTHYKCNANCVFCLGGDFPDFTLSTYQTLFEKKLAKVLKNADHIGFCGFGELFLMPGIIEFLRHIDATLKNNTKVFTTNGATLTPGILDCITNDRYALIVSLHASHKKLHEEIFRKKYFDRVLANIRAFNALRKKKRTTAHLNLAFLATAANIEDLPAFVRRAAELNADRVSVNYLTIFEPGQIALSCFFEQEKTNTMFDAAQREADARGITLALPPRFGRHDFKGSAETRCRDPWNFFYVETQGSVNPCCFAGNHIGYLDKMDFESIWNGPGYTGLREGLVSGTPHAWCAFCYKYDPNNVNDIRSHITFRPETQSRILKEVAKRKK